LGKAKEISSGVDEIEGLKGMMNPMQIISILLSIFTAGPGIDHLFGPFSLKGDKSVFAGKPKK
jgi:hypothetical protein